MGAEECDKMGRFGTVEQKTGCSILNQLQRSNGTYGETRQEGVAVIQTRDDKCLD